MPTGDNRSILDTTESQKLNTEEIERLKEEGVHGEVWCSQLALLPASLAVSRSGCAAASRYYRMASAHL